MAFYIQYNNDGEIVATVMSTGKPPIHPRQIALDEPISISHKRVNLLTKTIEDVPILEATEIVEPPQISIEDRIALLEEEIQQLKAGGVF